MPDITPNDVVNKEFHRGLRGYAVDQVDDFLQQVADSYFRALEESQRLRAQVDELRGRMEQYQQLEDVMKRALVLAERTADETRQRAHQEADLIRREMDDRMRSERAELETLHQTRERVLVEMRAMLQAHLSLLERQSGA